MAWPRTAATGLAAFWLTLAMWMQFMPVGWQLVWPADLILPPPAGASSTATPVALVLLPGALAPPAAYADLAAQLQAAASGPLYVAVPAVPLNVALFGVRTAAGRALASLQRAGLPADAPLFLGGHSLGAAAAQHLISRRALGRDVEAGVFLGSAANRELRGKLGVPWLSLSGELDGIHRPARAAEALYHARDAEAVVVLKGANHMQFTSIESTLITSRYDLLPEAPGPDVRRSAAELVLAFINTRLSALALPSKYKLARAADETRRLLQPLLDALVAEGNVFLKPQCNSDRPSPHCPFYPAWPPQKAPRAPSNATECFCGVPFSHTAVTMMAGLDASRYHLFSVDAVHNVRDMHPFHHAHVWNNCSGAPKLPCTLNVTTVSEPVYDWLERLVGWGFAHSTAREIRVKMKSRQVYQRHSSNASAGFSVDSVDVCADINRAAFEWALSRAPAATRARFEASGLQPRFLADHHFFLPIGPLWIETPLKLRVKWDRGAKQPYLGVTSISMRTDLDSRLNSLHPDSGGQHYCKVLSPARAMEWIYTPERLRISGAP
jgi:hypothetical protein